MDSKIGGVRIARVLAGALIGTVCTLVFYFIPFINSIAPLVGGLLGGYYAGGGIWEGLKTGVLMTIFMIIPGFLFGGILGALLRNTPVTWRICSCLYIYNYISHCSPYCDHGYNWFGNWSVY